MVNHITKKAYKGGNLGRLALYVAKNKLNDDEFLTFNQGRALNLKVKKGSKGCPLVWFSQGEERTDKNGKIKINRKAFRGFTVFPLSYFEEMKKAKKEESNVIVLA